MESILCIDSLTLILANGSREYLNAIDVFKLLHDQLQLEALIYEQLKGGFCDQHYLVALKHKQIRHEPEKEGEKEKKLAAIYQMTSAANAYQVRCARTPWRSQHVSSSPLQHMTRLSRKPIQSNSIG